MPRITHLDSEVTGRRLALDDGSARRPAEDLCDARGRCVRARGATQVKVPEIFQVETPHAPDGLASVLHAIAEAGLVVEHVSTVRRDQDRTLWEITVDIDESAHAGLLERLNALPSARFVGWSDRVFDRHRGGKIEMRSRGAISTQAHGSVPADTQRAEEPPEGSDPQSGAP